MANLMAEQNAIGVLSAATLPVEAGGGANPFYDLINFLDKTRGPWHHQNETRGGRKSFVSEINRQYGSPPSSGLILYRSPYFDPALMDIAIIPQALGVFTALGLYFELVNFPAFVQLADQQYGGQTPAYLPNSRVEVIDDEGSPTGETTVVTWDNWKDATHNHLSHDGQNYIPLNSNTGSSDCAGFVIDQLLGDGITVKPMSEWPVIESEV